jgi:transcriptional regulator with XRE-family HTH domain
MQALNSKIVKGGFRMSEIGEFLRKLRGKRSLREIEKISGVSHTYLSSLEKGADPRTGKERKPTAETLKKLAEVYDYDYIDLLDKAGYLTNVTTQEKETLTANHEFQKALNNLLNSFVYQIVSGNDFIPAVYDDIKKIEKKYENIFDENENLTPAKLQTLIASARYDDEWIYNLIYDLAIIARSYDNLHDLSEFLSLPRVSYKNKILSDDERKRILDMLKVLFPDEKEN